MVEKNTPFQATRIFCPKRGGGEVIRSTKKGTREMIFKHEKGINLD